MIKVTIDDVEIEVAPGTTILNAARQAGGDLVPPAMCYYSKLPGTGGKCRTCLVEVAAGSAADPRPMPKLVASCSTQVMDGMIVKNKTSQRVHNNLKYLINTSNESLENYESLAFSINILKDELPRLKVEMNRDSVELETLYFYGQASDDYGLNKLELIYYQTDTPENKFIKSIPIKQTNFDEFIYIFPNNLDLDNNVSYELYFKIYDNDIINGYKSVKSELFRYRKRSVKELALEKLNNQKATITDLNRSLNNFDKQDLELKNLTKNEK